MSPPLEIVGLSAENVLDRRRERNLDDLHALRAAQNATCLRSCGGNLCLGARDLPLASRDSLSAHLWRPQKRLDSSDKTGAHWASQSGGGARHEKAGGRLRDRV